MTDLEQSTLSHNTLKTSKWTAGVLGGMGPQASVDFMARVIAATDARCDQEHIHLLVDHNPGIANRHQSIDGSGPNVAPDLAAMAQRLQQAGADFLVMACNTAHAYTADIRAAVDIPFISIIDVVLAQIPAGSVSKVGVMAAQGCLRAELYQQALGAAGFDPVLWDQPELTRFMQLVYRIKAGATGADSRREMQQLCDVLVGRGAELIIAGCTEIPLVLPVGQSLQLLSSTDLLVARTIELARRGQLEQ